MTRRSPIYNLAADWAHECRQAWDGYLLDWEERAEDYTNNALTNKEGRAKGISLAMMISAPGHAARFRAYASEELREYARLNPPLNRNQYEQQWLDAQLGDLL